MTRESVAKDAVIEQMTIVNGKMAIRIETLQKAVKMSEVNFKSEVTKRFALNQVLQAMAEMFEDGDLKTRIFEFTSKVEYADNFSDDFDLVLESLQNVTVSF